MSYSVDVIPLKNALYSPIVVHDSGGLANGGVSTSCIFVGVSHAEAMTHFVSHDILVNAPITHTHIKSGAGVIRSIQVADFNGVHLEPVVCARAILHSIRRGLLHFPSRLPLKWSDPLVHRFCCPAKDIVFGFGVLWNLYCVNAKRILNGRRILQTGSPMNL
jgi:hypothetical protein